VVRTAREDAASLAGIRIPTEAVVVDAPKASAGAAASGMGDIDF
jgi:chaperonin GroEL